MNPLFVRSGIIYHGFLLRKITIPVLQSPFHGIRAPCLQIGSPKQKYFANGFNSAGQGEVSRLYPNQRAQAATFQAVLRNSREHAELCRRKLTHPVSMADQML